MWWRQGDTSHDIHGLDDHRGGMASKKYMSRLEMKDDEWIKLTKMSGDDSQFERQRRHGRVASVRHRRGHLIRHLPGVDGRKRRSGTPVGEIWEAPSYPPLPSFQLFVMVWHACCLTYSSRWEAPHPQGMRGRERSRLLT